MQTPIDLPQILDAAFVGLVVFTCWRTLFQGGPDRRTRRWRDELLRLDEMLRELLSEASAASTNLDRSLQRRKDELQQLLLRIENAKRPAAEPQAARQRSVMAREEEFEELPNASWGAAAGPRDARRAARGAAGARPLQGKTSAALSQKLEAVLAKQVEVSRDEDILARKGFVGEAGDPVAYKVALRLLRTGQEIHIVSRKLGLPVSEVRLIDRLMREDEEPMGEPEPAPEAPRVKQARAPEPRRPVPTSVIIAEDEIEAALLDEIERETAVL